MPTLNSSATSRVEYDPISGTLVITFRSGRAYAPRNGPCDHYGGPLNASSAGCCFNKDLRGKDWL